jgi:hypothetical protein
MAKKIKINPPNPARIYHFIKNCSVVDCKNTGKCYNPMVIFKFTKDAKIILGKDQALVGSRNTWICEEHHKEDGVPKALAHMLMKKANYNEDQIENIHFKWCEFNYDSSIHKE